MKYLSKESVLQSFEDCKGKTQNKFWGVIGIINVLGTKIIPAQNYSFSVEKIQVFLEDLFHLDSKKKNYSTSNKWSVIFSNQWIDNVPEQMLSSKPNVYNVAAWFFRRTAFEDDIAPEQIVGRFLDAINLTESESKKWFTFNPISFSFNSFLYSEEEFLELISKKLSISVSSNKTLSFEGQTFIKSSPGSLGQAPYIQTLYANQGIQKCLILTQFDFQELYPMSKDHGSPIDSSDLPLQQIFFGAPGTGKSHEVKKQTGELSDSDEERDLPNVFRTTFHPDTDYASFVGCYKPAMRKTGKKHQVDGKDVDDEEIIYEFVPQAFTDAYIYAYTHSTEQTYLVIEEINRGNCAQIFGDLFQLLDRKYGKSEYKIKADKDLANYLMDKLGKDSECIKEGKLCLPANLNILATMNTSDQSLFPMDSAFKRRWEWEYVPINYGTDIKSGSFEITIGDKTYPWVGFIKEVNKRIFDLTQSEDKQLGNFFIKHSVDEKEFKSKVMFYLWYEVLRDETENNKYFFYKKTIVDGKEASSKFIFKDLYEEAATQTLQQFMEYLGVTPK